MRDLSFRNIINENLTSVLMFVYSYKNLTGQLDGRRGGWEVLSKVIKELSSARAKRAVVELGILVRFLDDSNQIPDFLKDLEETYLGFVVGGSESGKQLSLREVSNKIVHSREFKWDFKLPEKPKLVCISNQPQRWESAEIDILEFSLLCSILINHDALSYLN